MIYNITCKYYPPVGDDPEHFEFTDIDRKSMMGEETLVSRIAHMYPELTQRQITALKKKAKKSAVVSI